MTNRATPLTIVYVESHYEWRRALGRLFIPGFDLPEVTFIQQEDFRIVREHLRQQTFASAYLLHGREEGMPLAKQIQEAAARSEPAVPVLTTLLSAKVDAVQIRGPDERIPIVDLLTHAPLVGFHIGNNMGRKNPSSLRDWLRNEKITLPPVNTVSRRLSDAAEVSEHPGAFYLTLSEFMDGKETSGGNKEGGHRNALKERMGKSAGIEGVRLLEATFGINPGTREWTPPEPFGVKKSGGLPDGGRPPRGER